MMRDDSRATAPRARRARSAALVGALALALAGCRDSLDDLTAVQLNDPEQRHAITMGSRTETLIVPVPSAGDSLAPTQEDDVMHFLARYKAEGRGKLRVSSSAGPGGQLTATQALRELQVLVDDAGIAPWTVEVVRHPSSSARRGLKLSYERVIAVPPVCGDWSENLGRPNRERTPAPNFGCATQRNLAVMVANPRDLVEPRSETPRSSEVRSAGWQQYTKAGSNTGASVPAPVATNSAEGATKR